MTKRKVADDIDENICRQVAALPFRHEKDGTISVLLVTSRTNHKWMLPKGWPMAGKSDAEAAAQEAFEEAGVRGASRKKPIGSYDFIKLFEDGSSKPSQAIIFPLEVTDELKNWPEKGQRKRKWLRAEKAAALAFEEDLSRFLLTLASGSIVL